MNLHSHTYYSFLDGHASPERLATRALELGMPAVTTTDHGNVHSWLPFYDAVSDVGLQPILGLEAYQARKTRADRDEEERASGKAADERDQRGPYHLTLLARDQTGYHNLMRLSSRAYLEGFYVKPRLDYELLAAHHEGVTILSGCLNSAVQQALLRDDYPAAREHAARLQAIAGREFFYLEIQDHGLAEQRRIAPAMVRLAQDLDAPLVATGDCHYVHREDAALHDVMLCVATAATLAQEQRFRFHNDEFYLKSYEEMAARVDPAWLENSLRVAGQIELHLEPDAAHFPPVRDLPPGHSVASYLEELSWAGLVQRYGSPLPAAVRSRAEHELAVVARMGFQSYFLVVGDLVRWAKSQGIRCGWGRGSAAGSVLSYALGITNLDPLRFGLLFERFLVEGRKSAPDIDLDFDDRHRDRVIDYARSRYGADHVAHIGTFGSIQARTAVKDAARVLGYDFGTGDTISKAMPPLVMGTSTPLAECLERDDFRRMMAASPAHTHIVDTALGLEGLPRQAGMHAAGVVITPGPTMDYVPVLQKGADKPVITQWDMEGVERVGVLKIDFLGLRNLGLIDALEHELGISVDAIPLDDEATYAMLSRGETAGVFQLESSGMTAMTRALQPNRIEDVMAVIALYRPGPLGSGMDKTYIARRHGSEPVPEDELGRLLAATYGLMLYQEDVLLVAREVAGFSPGQADDLRKAIGKKQSAKLGALREAFVAGAQSRGVPAVRAQRLYRDIEYFGGYGFGAAHAASYAMISYVTAYLKCHYPLHYLAALFTSVADKRDRLAAYFREGRRMGVELRPPSVQHSRIAFGVEDDAIRVGLGAIKGLGEAVLATHEPRSYATLRTFLRDCPDSYANRAVLEALVSAGALDDLVTVDAPVVVGRARRELLEAERVACGTYLSDHPLVGVWPELAGEVTHRIEALVGLGDRSLVSVAGIVRGLSRSTTKRGQSMARFMLEDLSAEVEVLVFGGALRQLESVVEHDLVVVKARVHHDRNDPTGVACYLQSVERRVAPTTTSEAITITCPGGISPGLLDRLGKIIDDIPGDTSVYLRIPEGPHMVVCRYRKPTAPRARSVLEAAVAASCTEKDQDHALL